MNLTEHSELTLSLLRKIIRPTTELTDTELVERGLLFLYITCKFTPADQEIFLNLVGKYE